MGPKILANGNVQVSKRRPSGGLYATNQARSGCGRNRTNSLFGLLAFTCVCGLPAQRKVVIGGRVVRRVDFLLVRGIRITTIANPLVQVGCERREAIGEGAFLKGKRSGRVVGIRVAVILAQLLYVVLPRTCKAVLRRVATLVMTTA